MASAEVDPKVRQIGSVLSDKVDELGSEVASSVQSNVDFYKSTGVVTEDELLASSTENIRFLVGSLRDGEPFDTSPAVATGARRAAAGVPLPSVMDAFRVASHHLWDTVVDVAGPDISRDALLRATALLWQAQDVYTDAMTAGYRQQAMQQMLDDEAERSALTEALLQARITDDRSLWEVAQLLRLPQKGPYVVIAATCPAVGKQALPGIAAKLRSVDIFSAWRLLPDVQVGIAHVPSTTEHRALVALLTRVGTTRIGVSSPFDDLADTAQALRYARVAANARGGGEKVTVFEESILAVAAVSAPEVTNKVADIILGPFGELTADERDVLFETFRAWVRNEGSMADTAAELFCHPNTVRYRLHRIEERTERSLSVPNELAELCLAFETYWNGW
jgi:hypothetical protein